MKPHSRVRPVLGYTCAATLLCTLASPIDAVILGQCTVSASGVAFGIYDPLVPTALTSTATINVSCTLVSNASNITIDLSSGASGSFSSRTMSSGTDILSYNLFQDIAQTQIWGDGTGGSTEFTGKVTPGKPSLTATAYGLLSASQDVGAGSYLDTITVTVNY
jgi:spore coat protein U-like protein